MTTPDTERLRRLAAEATPGPWHPHPAGKYVWTEELGGIIQNWSDDANAVADMEFIAAAREAVPALLDRIARLEAQSDIRGRAVVMYRDRAREAEARIKAVRELHSESRIIPGTPVFGCAECGEPNETEPCATIRALEG